MTTTPRTLDWSSRHDPRSRNYPIRALIGDSVPRVLTMWEPGQLLDQGQEGACVGHGWTNEATSSPVRIHFGLQRLGRDDQGNRWPRNAQKFAFALYEWCKRHDEYPGENYDGTSVLTGAKGMKMLGFLKEYRWAFGLDDVIDSLCAHGPVVLGINWYDGMYEAPGGEVHLSGPVVGGHCILAIGYDPTHQWADGSQSAAVALFNSWGDQWGINGVAWLPVADLARLLANQGEACVPVTRGRGNPFHRLGAVVTSLKARLVTALAPCTAPLAA